VPRLRPSLPLLGSLSERLRAFRSGRLELVLAEFAARMNRGGIELRKLHQARPDPRGQKRSDALLRLHCRRALNTPVDGAAITQAGSPARPLLAGSDSRLPNQSYPAYLVIVGHDRFGRACRLQPNAAKAWLRLHQAAIADGIELDLVSGFRSIAYQNGIWRRKLARGQSIAQIGQVSALPGRSEHHSGRALDLASGDGPVLEQDFAQTAACRWLKRNAHRYGFVESYPRNNPYGIVAEPWHWCWRST